MKLALLVLCALLVCVSAHDGARLLVRKAPMNRQIVANELLFVNVHIYNVGTKDAHNVMYKESWDEGFEKAVGLTSAYWDVIPSGQNVTHTFALKPVIVGKLKTEPATVEYRDSVDGDVRITHATDFGELEILSEQESGNTNKPFIFEWAVFGGLMFFTTFPAYYVWSSTKKSQAAAKSAKKVARK
eukprot:CAMPEP_0177674748 /NCGR_PEP_ID=MMETSP0447-20121125/26765_1 /TAXON_ID=0 /ORGANISM="Stygamoeba regulata, Strain BSH-02190019" /LENGTH=185 /DNA_ID=CAMNT_0019182953 /DNA_START=42 /DNA_END=599 /DNA_ORIENTATION=-